MFSPYNFIDKVQDLKKSAFNYVVSDPELRKVSDRYINTQTEFAKMIVSNAFDLAKYSLDKVYPRKKETVAAPYKVESPAERAANTDTQGE